MIKNLKKFIKESNIIEGITEYSEDDQVDVYLDFIKLDKISVDSIIEFTRKIHALSFDRNGRNPYLRSGSGMDVRVGNHTPIMGGADVVHAMRKFIDFVNNDKCPYKNHVFYEHLHPLTDGNGRSGRAVWLWQMCKRGYDLELGFLHKYYYQSLESERKISLDEQ